MDVAGQVAAGGGSVSIDANYAGKIWPNRLEALAVIEQYLSQERSGGLSLAKFSDVDFHRLFGEEVKERESAVQRIHDLGADVVCLTLGQDGCCVSHGTSFLSLPTRPVAVQDTTGAGDAFWSGFLAAYQQQYGWEDCARAGRGVAERKLVTVGPMHDPLSLKEVIESGRDGEV